MRKKDKEIGEVVCIEPDIIYIRNSKKELDFIEIMEPYAKNLSVMPF